MNKIRVGARVNVPWWRNGKRVRNLRGYITAINGAYHSVKVLSTKRYDIIELLEAEFKVMG